MLALAALATLPFLLPGSALFMPLQVAATLAAWVILFRFAYVVLEQTSLGRLSPADYPLGASGADPYKP